MLIDTIIYRLMQQVENPTTTITTKIISIIFDPTILVIITLTISAYLAINYKKKQALFFASTILITATIIEILKRTLKVARPTDSIISEIGFSLPSGHATMAVVFLGLASYILIKKNPLLAKIVINTTILAVGFSRIYLRVHWFSDILVGLILGLIILIIATQIYDKINFSKSNKSRRRS